MVNLNIDINTTGLNKIGTAVQKAFENLRVGMSERKERSGGPGALAIGGSVALLSQLVQKTQAIQTILDVVAGLLNQLIAPFVPLLIGLIKPVFILLQKFLIKALQSFGLTPNIDDGGSVVKNDPTSMFLKISGAILAGIAAVVVAITAGIGILTSLLIGLFVTALSAILFDFGARIGEALASLVFKAFNGLDAIFGTNFIGAITQWAEGLKSVFDGAVEIIQGIWNIFTGNFSDGFKLIGQGFKDIFFGVLNTLAGLFDAFLIQPLQLLFKLVIVGLQKAWNFLLNSMSKAINFFASLFLKALNGVISLINKVPGVNVGRIRSSGEQVRNTQININVEGSADEKTIQATIKRLRVELNKRAAF